MKYCFDIDETICRTSGTNYQDSVPIPSRIGYVIHLLESGHDVVFFTARGFETGKDWTEVTRRQLESWGIKDPQVYFGKPSADLYIDDKCQNSEEFWNGIKAENKQ